MKTELASQGAAEDAATEQGAPASPRERRSSQTELADPFAIDLFAAGAAHARRPEPPARAAGETEAGGADVAREPAVAWHARLPRVGAEEARRSRLLARLPERFADEIITGVVETLARLTGSDAGDSRLELLGVSETSATAARPGDPGARAIAELILEPAGASVVVELTSEFAREVVGRVLGADDARLARGALSPVEAATLEFVFLSVARAANRAHGSPLWRLGRIGGAVAANAEEAEIAARGYTIAARVRIDAARDKDARIDGVARLHLSGASLDRLASLGAERDRMSPPATQGERLGRLRRVAPRVRLSVRLGETTLSGLDLAALEAGDVVLVERPAVRRGAEAGELRFEGASRVQAGGRDGVLLAGAVVAAGAGDELALRFERIETEGKAGGAEERVTMNGEGIAEAEGAAGDAGALERVTLTVHVELGARRVTLDELAALRPGQIVELGCRATDPVDLTTENGAIARGELIDIDGRLGVRITRVLV